MNAYVDIDQGIHKWKSKVAWNEKRKKLCGFSYRLSANLLFLKSGAINRESIQISQNIFSTATNWMLQKSWFCFFESEQYWILSKNRISKNFSIEKQFLKKNIGNFLIFYLIFSFHPLHDSVLILMANLYLLMIKVLYGL